MSNLVSYGKQYMLLEKPDPNIKGLKEIGRFKLGQGFVDEFSLCPKNKNTGRYETGLNKYCSEFHGKDEASVKKTLDDRNKLIEYFQQVLESKGQTEEEYLNDSTFTAEHEKVVNTNNMQSYLELWLVMQGRNITPESERGNPKYSRSNFILVDFERNTSIKEERAKQKMAITTWLVDANNKDNGEVVATLRYADLIRVGETKSKEVIFSYVQDVIANDLEKMEQLHHIITKVPVEDRFMYDDLRKKLSKREITKEAGVFTYKGEPLGSDLKTAVSFLRRKENAELAADILS